MSVISNSKINLQSAVSSWLEINLNHLKNNLQYLKSKVGSGTGVLAVVKANAYGHDLVRCAKALEPSVEYLGVSDLKEAIDLREAGIQKPILIFGFVSASEIPALIGYDLTATLSDITQAENLNHSLEKSGYDRKLKVHVKVDTGMSRLGLSHRFATDEVLKIFEMKYLDLEGIFTHLAVADKKEDPFTFKQLERFQILLDQLSQSGLSFRWRHAANSGGIMNFRSSHFNLVRPGLALYGLFDEESEESAFKPVLSWKSRVRLIKRIKPGDSVSYGRLSVAEEPMRIGVVPVGYSHGYPTSASLKAHVLINGRVFPILGQVCMDYIVVDLGLEEDIKEGDPVVLIGSSGERTITATGLSKWAGTIPYEIVTRLPSSLPRIFSE